MERKTIKTAKRRKASLINTKREAYDINSHYPCHKIEKSLLHFKEGTWNGAFINSNP